jgi:hypothetical protein
LSNHDRVGASSEGIVSDTDATEDIDIDIDIDFDFDSPEDDQMLVGACSLLSPVAKRRAEAELVKLYGPSAASPPFPLTAPWSEPLGGLYGALLALPWRDELLDDTVAQALGLLAPATTYLGPADPREAGAEAPWTFIVGKLRGRPDLAVRVAGAWAQQLFLDRLDNEPAYPAHVSALASFVLGLLEVRRGRLVQARRHLEQGGAFCACDGLSGLVEAQLLLLAADLASSTGAEQDEAGVPAGVMQAR